MCSMQFACPSVAAVVAARLEKPGPPTIANSLIGPPISCAPIRLTERCNPRCAVQVSRVGMSRLVMASLGRAAMTHDKRGDLKGAGAKLLAPVMPVSFRPNTKVMHFTLLID